MNKIEKIRKEIERSREVFRGADFLADHLLAFLDTISEEPDKSLKEAAEDAICMAFGGDPAYYGNKAEFSVNECLRLFIAGAEWQKEQDNYGTIFYKGMMYYRKGMMEEAEEVEVWNYFEGESDRRALPIWGIDKYNYLNDGDKVRIIVLKAEEEEE